jgi:ABC-type uncharacterized transport system substrate-binding protein
MGTIKQYRITLLVLILISCCLTAGSDDVYAKDRLLIIRMDDEALRQAVQGLRSQIRQNFLTDEMIVSANTTGSEISQKMKDVSPKLVVLMDNAAISLYKKFQKGLPDSSQTVPSVSMMASFMDLVIRDMKNATGIFYEVPVVTSAVSLRSVMPSVPLKKIGLVHREFMEQSVKINREYCKKENIELVSRLIPGNGNIGSDLERALNQLRDQNIDALWIPNDNKIINPSLFKSVWIPFAGEFRNPIIVGVEVLVQPKFRFGTFAVIPDPFELGTQAAEIIYDIRDNNWSAEGREIEPPRSVYKFLNMEQAQRLFRIDKEKLGNVDKILQ